MPNQTEDPAEKAADIAKRVTEEARRNGQSVDDRKFREIYLQARMELVFPSEFPIEALSE